MGSADGVFYTRYLNDSNAIISIAGSPGTSIGNRDGIGFNASSSNSIYGKSDTVQPKSLNVNLLIKY